MSIFQWPFKRKTYAGILNPRFVSDVQAANEAVLDGLMAVCGLNATDFYIFSGFSYAAGAPGTYTAGTFFLNGSFYISPGQLNEGQALIALPVDTLQEPFQDGTPRNIYTLNQGGIVNGITAGSSPAFAGNMNAFRLDNKTLATLVAVINFTIASLKGGAFADIGQTPGTVAAGDDNRFGYTVAQINTLFALKSQVLLFGGANAFTPTQPNDPATKAYADTLSAKRLASGNTVIGDIPSGGISVNISFGLTLANSNYMLIPVCISLGTPFNDATAHWPAIFNKTTTGCTIRLQEGVGLSQNISIDWIVFGF